MQRRCRKAQNNWIEGRYRVETLFRIGKVDADHRKIKENFSERRVNTNIVRYKNGKALTKNRDKVNRWVEFIKSLYKGDVVADLIEKENEVQDDDRGNSILKEECENALRGLKANKAPGVDLIAADLLQSLGQAENNMLFRLVYDMYETDDIPNDQKVNKSVTIPKKVGADKCENYRTISLTTHASKILTTIIYRRLEQTIGNSFGKDQFGFRKETGTREALLRRGVRQGCPLSPSLFSLYSEEAINEIVEETKNIGLKLQGKTIKMLRFADDIALLANTEKESKITRDGRRNADIRSRIGQAKKASNKIPQLLVSNTNREIIKKLLKT